MKTYLVYETDFELPIRTVEASSPEEAIRLVAEIDKENINILAAEECVSECEEVSG